MFGIGTQEILIVLVLAIIIIGPKRLPEMATTMGKGFAEFKKAFDGLKEGVSADLRTELEKEDLVKKYPHLAESETAQPAAARVEEIPEAGVQPPAGDGPPDLDKLEPSYKPEEMES